MKKRQRHITWILHQFAFLKLFLRGLGVQLVLAGWVVPDFLGRAFSRFRSGFPVARTALTVILCAAVIVPWMLYKSERVQRMEMTRAFNRLDVETGAEIATLGASLNTLLDEQIQLRDLLLDAGYSVVSGNRLWMQLLATGYSSSVWETDDTPFITASNTRTRPGVVALSRDILRRYNRKAPFTFGDAIHISGIGDFVVEDSMHGRWRKRLDIWFPSREAASNFGIRRVTVSLPLMPLDGVESEIFDPALDYSAATGYAANSALPQ
jgi:3D (Asp-Asp-Asp) domain-containing protein